MRVLGDLRITRIEDNLRSMERATRNGSIAMSTAAVRLLTEDVEWLIAQCYEPNGQSEMVTEKTTEFEWE